MSSLFKYYTECLSFQVARIVLYILLYPFFMDAGSTYGVRLKSGAPHTCIQYGSEQTESYILLEKKHIYIIFQYTWTDSNFQQKKSSLLKQISYYPLPKVGSDESIFVYTKRSVYLTISAG